MSSTGKKVDFHLHTIASDGLYSPFQLVKLAAECGLTAAAITDHETVAGVKEASKAGSQYNVEVIPGVEISAGYKGRELHLLGYYPEDIDNLEKLLDQLREERFNRMEKMIKVLEKIGFPVEWDDVAGEAGNAAPGRLHLARVMQKKGHVATIEEAFNLYMGRGKPVYIPRVRLKVEEAIKVLLECKAIPVLAHPGVTEEDTDALFTLKKVGLKGIEVFHPEHTRGLTLFYESWARREKMLITGGSDYHGDAKENCPYPGCVSLDYTYLEAMKSLCVNMFG